jgi:hypothetical protein
MKYFIDTEFLEGTQKEKFPVSLFRKETKPTIDLISIGIVAEDGREYYAISKDFNLREAWNRWQLRTGQGDRNYLQPREYWIRENVLKPIFNDLTYLDRDEDKHSWFTYKNFKYLINKYGKTNKQIAEDILEFVYPLEQWHALHENSIIDKSFPKTLTLGVGTFATVKELLEYSLPQIETPQFYGYFADYDWVVFCWLFGKMIDLPKGFPMYCTDLKQELDKKTENLQLFYCGGFTSEEKDRLCSFDEKIHKIKTLPNYPQQTTQHNALADARWNKKLYEFLQTL